LLLYASDERCLGRKNTVTRPRTPITAATTNIPEYPRNAYTTLI